MAQISLCIISSLEDVAHAKALIETLRSHVDEVCLTVTDKSFDEEIPGVKVSTYKWDDNFANARNFNFLQATGEWVLWLDADDTLEHPELLRDLIKEAELRKIEGYFFL